MKKFQTNPLKDYMRLRIRRTRNKIIVKGRANRLNRVYKIVSVNIKTKFK